MALTPVPPQTRQYQVWAAPPSTVIAGLALGMGWFMPLSDPPKPEPGLSAAWMQYHTGFLAPATETITTNWLQPFSEPVRAKQGLNVASQQAVFKSVAPWCLSREIWNSADKSATIALSDNNLTATKISSDGNSATARGTISRNVGKVYFEALTVNYLTNQDVGVGIANSSQGLDGVGPTVFIGDATGNGFGFYYSNVASGLYINNVATNFFSANPSDNVGIAIDFDRELVWVRKNGGSWFGSGGLGGDPVAGTNGLSFAGLNAGPWFPATSNGKVGESATIQTYPPYTYTPPIGFGNWQDGDPAPWYVQLTEPVRLEPGLSAAWTQYHTGFLVPTAETITTNWLNRLSEPVRAKPNIEPFTTDWKWDAPAVVTNYNWFAPLSEPPPLEQGLGAAYQQVSTVGTAVAFREYVFPPFGEPVRIKAGLHASQQQFLVFNPTPPAVTDLRNYWYRPLSEPVRSKKSVPWQQFLTIDWRFTAPAFLSWHRPLSEPVRSKTYQPWQPYLTITANYAPIVLADSWWRPLSEPVRSKESRPWQQFWTTDWAQISDLRVYWYRPLSEPVRVKPAVAWQQFFTTDPTTPAAFTDLRNYWYQPLSEPVRSKQRTAWYQPFATDWQWNVVVRLEWFEALSEPVRGKPNIRWREPFTTDWQWNPTTIADLRWYTAFSEPVRSKKAVPWQQFFATDTAQITDLRVYWYQPLSEPVRSKVNIRWREPFTTDWQWRAPAPSIGWYQPLSERIRAKQSVPWQQPFTTDWKWTPPAGQVFAGWYEWLGEPVRQKQGLHAARQQFFTTDWKWTAPAFLSWHQWFREPVRQKPGLHASRQPFYQTDWQWTAPPTFPVSYTLNATESGDYGRLFYTSMDICVGAYVTITEEEVGNMAVVVITERSE